MFNRQGNAKDKQLIHFSTIVKNKGQESIWETLSDIGVGSNISNKTLKSTGNENKNSQVGLYQTKKLVHSKIYNNQSRETTDRMKKAVGNYLSNEY